MPLQVYDAWWINWILSSSPSCEHERYSGCIKYLISYVHLALASRGGCLLCSLSPEARQWQGQAPSASSGIRFHTSEVSPQCVTQYIQHCFSFNMNSWNFSKFFLTLKVQEDGQCQSSLLQFYDVHQTKRWPFSLPLLLGCYFITIPLKTKISQYSGL